MAFVADQQHHICFGFTSHDDKSQDDGCFRKTKDQVRTHEDCLHYGQDDSVKYTLATVMVNSRKRFETERNQSRDGLAKMTNFKTHSN